MLQRIRPPHWLGIAVLAVGLTLVIIDIRNQLDHLNDWSAVRSDLRTVVAVLAVMVYIRLTGDRHEAMLQPFLGGRVWPSRSRPGDEPRTQDLGAHLTIVGTAAVQAATPVRPDELPGFAYGYAACRANHPDAPDAKVIPIDGHRN